MSMTRLRLHVGMAGYDGDEEGEGERDDGSCGERRGERGASLGSDGGQPEARAAGGRMPSFASPASQAPANICWPDISHLPLPPGHTPPIYRAQTPHGRVALLSPDPPSSFRAQVNCWTNLCAFPERGTPHQPALPGTQAPPEPPGAHRVASRNAHPSVFPIFLPRPYILSRSGQHVSVALSPCSFVSKNWATHGHAHRCLCTPLGCFPLFLSWLHRLRMWLPVAVYVYPPVSIRRPLRQDPPRPRFVPTSSPGLVEVALLLLWPQCHIMLGKVVGSNCVVIPPTA